MSQKPLQAVELINRHSRGIWRYLRALGCDDSTADDLTQDTFLRVLRRESFVQHNDAATAAYLRRTAYNLLISYHRTHNRMNCVPEASSIDEVWNRWTGKDLVGDQTIDALKDCFSKLSERAQLALTMRFANDASRQQIAEKLTITEHGARNLMQRAKATLRTCVEARMLENSDDE